MKYGLRPAKASARGLNHVAVEDADHYRLMREFWTDPRGFIETMLEE